MTTRHKLLAQVHLGAKRKGMDDDTYRDWLERETGQRSCKQLTDTQLSALVQELRGAGALDDAPPGTVGRPDRPTRPQWARLGTACRALGWSGTADPRFAAFVKRTARVDHPRFLDRKGASKVITGLEAWARSHKPTADPIPA